MTTIEPEAAALRAVGTPVCSLAVRVADAEHVRLHQAWIGAEATALRLDTEGEAEELITVATDHMPAAIARLLRLGPRNVVARGTISAPLALVDRAFSADPEERAAVAAQIIGDGTDRWRFSTVETMWPDARQQLSGRALMLADSPGGLHRLMCEGSSLHVEPVTPTEAWRLLIALLPSDPELGHAER